MKLANSLSVVIGILSIISFATATPTHLISKVQREGIVKRVDCRDCCSRDGVCDLDPNTGQPEGCTFYGRIC